MFNPDELLADIAEYLNIFASAPDVASQYHSTEELTNKIVGFANQLTYDAEYIDLTTMLNNTLSGEPSILFEEGDE